MGYVFISKWIEYLLSSFEINFVKNISIIIIYSPDHIFMFITELSSAGFGYILNQFIYHNFLKDIWMKPFLQKWGIGNSMAYCIPQTQLYFMRSSTSQRYSNRKAKNLNFRDYTGGNVEYRLSMKFPNLALLNIKID